MRLNRLELIRYGRFSDAHIDFPKPLQGAPDVTLIFGENEAGKSTAFNGLLELLFGFKSKSHPYAFRFDRKDLLVGAELDLPGRGPTVLRRNAKQSQSLLDADERPIAEAVLAGALHGLTREAYEERFSLNDHGLREGGERIAGAKGELGQLLHAGLSGLTGMADALATLEQRADDFHKKRGRGTILKQGADRLKALRTELRSHSLTVEQERALAKNVERALSAFEFKNEDLGQVHKRQAASRAAEIWHDQSKEIERLEAALADAPSGEPLPADAAVRVEGLVEKATSQKARLAELERDLAKQEAIIAAHPTDKLADTLEAELKQLDALQISGAPLISRASSAKADLVRRREECAGLEQQIVDLIERLGVQDALALKAGLQACDLEHLATSAQACLAASHGLSAAQNALDVALDQRGDAPAEPQDLTELRAAFEAWETTANASTLEAAHDQAMVYLSKVSAELPDRWTALVAAGLPALETLDEAARDQASLRAELASAQKELELRAKELAEARANQVALETAPEAVDISVIERTRGQREREWQAHRSDLSPQTADQFEAAMQADDSARAHFYQGAEVRQQMRAAAQAVVRSAAQHDLAKTQYEELITQFEHLTERCAKMALALGFAADTSAAAFKARHQNLSAAAAAAADVSNTDKALQDHRRRQAHAYQDLATAVQILGNDVAQGDIPAQARLALTLEQSGLDSWRLWQQGEQKIAMLDKALERAHMDHEQALIALAQLTVALPLADTSPEGVQAALPLFRSLQHLYNAHKDLTGRIRALEQAIETLEISAARLSRILEQDREDGADPLEIIGSARARLDAAKRSDEKRSSAAQEHEGVSRAIDRLAKELEDAQAQLAECFDGQGALELAPRARVARLVERDQLRAARASSQRARKDAREGVDDGLFLEELEQMPDATRPQELERVAQDAQQARDTARDAYREAERVYAEALNADERSDLTQEQATLRETLRSKARQAAVSRLGVLAAKGALRRLAEERRGKMLEDVEEAFITMTSPAWKGVEVWSPAEGDKLVGIQPNGNRVPVEQMSTGTMGQLYFALRLAGYQSFAQDAGPLPLVLDDIMETFDDTRARAALQLCAKIGASGQVILFTHHKHLVELATECIQGAGIVNMPA